MKTKILSVILFSYSLFWIPVNFVMALAICSIASLWFYIADKREAMADA